MRPLDVQPSSPSISVVIPTYNDVARIGDALSSIVAQTMRPAEIVVSDDASDDGTEGFVREFASQHADFIVRYIRRPVRSGGVTARNEGIMTARGEWIANCDSDDFWDPAKLERQVTFIREWRGRERIAVLGTRGYNTNDARRVISPSAVMGPATEDDYSSLRKAGGVFLALHSSILFTRADFIAVGGYSEEYSAGGLEDCHFLCKMAERGVIITVPEPLTYYRKRDGSMQIDRYWHQRDELPRLALNQQRRAAGDAPLDRQAFARLLASASTRLRFRRWRLDWGKYYYRAGAVAIVNGHRTRGLAQLALASLMDTGRVRAGLANAWQFRLRERRSSRDT